MNLLKVLFLAGLSLALTAGALWAKESMDVPDLGQYHWQNRLLFLFAPSSEDLGFQSLSGEMERNLDGIRDGICWSFASSNRAPVGWDGKRYLRKGRRVSGGASV